MQEEVIRGLRNIHESGLVGRTKKSAGEELETLFFVDSKVVERTQCLFFASLRSEGYPQLVRGSDGHGRLMFAWNYTKTLRNLITVVCERFVF